MIRLDRRHVLAGSCALIATPGPARSAVAQDHDVFWKAAPAGAAPTILFGFDVVAAAAAPNLLATGERLAAPTQHLILDVPAFRMADRRIRADTSPPLSDRFGQANGQKLLEVLRAIVPQGPNVDTLPGVMVVLLLLGEGRTPNGTGDTLPVTLFARIFRTGEATSYLIPYDEVVRRNFGPDPAAAEQRIDRKVIEVLLDYRTRLGPLGKYAETLYVQERLYDLWRFHHELEQHGFTGVVPAVPAYAEALAARAIGAVKAARKPTFLMLPSDNLVRDDGILARLERDGVPVEPTG